LVKIENSLPSNDRSSSARCGANGEMSIVSISNVFLSMLGSSVR